MRKILVIIGILLLLGCTNTHEVRIENKIESEKAIYEGVEVRIPEGEIFKQFTSNDRLYPRIVTYDTLNNIHKVYSLYVSYTVVELNLLFKIR